MAGSVVRRDPLFSLLGMDPFSFVGRMLESPTRPLLRRSTLSTREAYANREKDDLVVNIDVPGVDPEFGIKVSVKNQALVIHTTRTWAVDAENSESQNSETATFAVELPRHVEQNAIEASIAHGVLTVRVKGVYQEVDDGRSFEVPVAIAGDEKKPQLESTSA